MQERKDIVVGGFGNPLMADEGIGLEIVRELSTKSANVSRVDFVELGSSLMSVVHVIARRRKAVLVDCAWMDEAPGAIRRFSPDDIVSKRAMPRFSLHDGDLLGALELSRTLGEYPEEVVIFGIQPEKIALHDGLSHSLGQRLKDYVEAVDAELDRSQVRWVDG